ncbi:ABC transporter substrate-binding protein [Paenibacillus glucanolyticus]|uniref:ABC transporter substrate-binding protein n=2 Tax=Paenibacillus TaxID=44249 RepID=UPI001164D8A7|nr:MULTISPECIES: extracellular solute-binding protein [Paenibacillus]AWP26185.1 sugar ABC transporter substrate-binding protein [Paenibacillus sp. Cedars]MDH6670364.1 raffinose/stachyose/melibiose transport system substrate-binding protein [Paenibacillus sp. LBL]MPY20611.1 extracellular solute-binding protein [Paenibacillus glucanolyticus]
MIKKLSAVLLAGALTFSLTACGGSSDSADKETPAKGDKKVIKILHWKQDNINKAVEEINKKFEEKYPEYKVEYTTTGPDDEFKQAQRARITANDVDVLADLSGMRLSPQEWTPGAKVPDWQQWIDTGLIADLSDQAFIKNYNANDIEKAGTYNDKVYAVPTGKVAMSGLFYNKEIFEQNGLSVPKTWSEFIMLNDDLKAKGITPIVVAGKDVWPLKLPVFALQAKILGGGDQQKWIEGVWKGETAYNDEEAVEVLEKMKTLQDNYMIDGFMGIDYATAPSYFATGKAAMLADGSWDAPTIAAANPELKFGYFPLPATEDAAKNASFVGKYDVTWYAAEKGPNKEGALKWLEFFSEPENYTTFVKAAGFIPTQDNIQTESDFIDNELTPYLGDFELAYEIMMINRQNIGEHLAAEGVHTEFLAPGGLYKTAKELADIQQKEWEAAAPK